MLLHELLSLCVVLDPDPAVALLPVFQTGLIHLPSQPFPAVDPNLDVERKPRLDARMHPTQHRMDLVVIQHVAGSHTTDDVRPPVFQGGTRLHRTEGTHRSPFGCLSRRPGAAPTHPCPPSENSKTRPATSLARRPQRFLLQPFTGPLHMIAVLFEQNLVLPQILLHADGPRRLQRQSQRP